MPLGEAVRRNLQERRAPLETIERLDDAWDARLKRAGGWRVFVDPFSAQYISGVSIDYVTSMQGSGFTFKNPNATGGCGCGSSFNA